MTIEEKIALIIGQLMLQCARLELENATLTAALASRPAVVPDPTGAA